MTKEESETEEEEKRVSVFLKQGVFLKQSIKNQKQSKKSVSFLSETEEKEEDCISETEYGDIFRSNGGKTIGNSGGRRRISCFENRAQRIRNRVRRVFSMKQMKKNNKQRRKKEFLCTINLTYMNCLEGRFIDLPEMLFNGFELIKLLEWPESLVSR